MKIKKIIRLLLLLAIIIIFLCLLSIFGAQYIISTSAKNLTYSNTDDIPHNRVGVVLGTAKMFRKGVPNLYYKHRINATKELFSAGKIDFVLVSGDNRHRSYNEPNDFKKSLIEAGIPEDKIFLDYAGFRTYDSMIRADKVFGQKKFTVISQKFHNERAIYIARRLGLDVIGYNAHDVESYYGFKTNLREKFARVKVFVDFLFDKKPHFLGDPVVIE
ncbi:MAG: ElyC/SanA/YdcF family protein [Bacteroidales bacterium]|nr:ElyC/SanA/YdcF family protein [Bacteroidales bacterium]